MIRDEGVNAASGGIVGVDTGGTFTDFVVLDAEGRMTVDKRPSTPGDPAESLIAGLQALRSRAALKPGFTLVHGTTVATNALLERRGAETGLLTTQGFRDVLAIGRQTRNQLYSLSPTGVDCLLPQERRLEAAERVDWQGNVLQSLDETQVEAALDAFQRMGVESLAVCFLFSFLNSTHERRVGELARRRGFAVSLSCDIAPEPREYERTSTAVANAFVAPVVTGYLHRLSAQLTTIGCDGFRVMQSDGGALSRNEAAGHAIKTALSGPAAGVVAAAHVGREAGYDRLLTFDMGGTSTDVALLVNGQCALSMSGHVAGLPLLTPMLDIHTVGAGGGSVARVDDAGGLRVGPQSAGADPGPVAYGKGDDLTVTDAHVLLGRLPADVRLAGHVALDAPRVRAKFVALARKLACSPERAALGVLAVANAAMSRALGYISLQRGHDPYDFALLSFGGAGGLHACELASSLDIRTVVVPRFPGAFSALGLAVADVRREAVRVVPAGLRADTAAPAVFRAIRDRFRDLEEQIAAEMRAEGLAAGDWLAERLLELRYVGQSFSLRVPTDATLDIVQACNRFHTAHRERYGHSDPLEPVEVTAARMVATGRSSRPAPHARSTAAFEQSPRFTEVYEANTWLPAAIRMRDTILPGRSPIAGPCIIVQDDATTYAPTGWSVSADNHHNLVLRREG